MRSFYIFKNYIKSKLINYNAKKAKKKMNSKDANLSFTRFLKLNKNKKNFLVNLPILVIYKKKPFFIQNTKKPKLRGDIAT